MRAIASWLKTLPKRIGDSFPILADIAAFISALPGKMLEIVSPFEVEIIGFLSAFMLSFSTLYCLVTAHSIPVAGAGMFFGCVIVSALMVGWQMAGGLLSENEEKKKYRLIVDIGVPAAASIVMFLMRKPLVRSARVALYILLNRYGINFPETPEGEALAETATLFLVCLAVLPSATAAWSVMRGKTPFVAAAGSVPIFALSIIIFQQLPSAWAVCMFVFSLALIIFTHRACRYSEESGFLHTVRVAPTLALVLLVIALIIDPSEYKTPEWWEKIQNEAYEVFESVTGYGDANEFISIDTTTLIGDTTFDLEDLGPQSKRGLEVMQVRSNSGSYFYLRGRSYAHYSDNEWQMLTEEEAARINALVASPLTSEENDAGENIEFVFIRTAERQPMIFLPYSAGSPPDGSVPYGDSYIENNTALLQYHITRGSYKNTDTFIYHESEDMTLVYEYQELVREYYLEVPETTGEELRRIACEEGIITAEEAEAGAVAWQGNQRFHDVVDGVTKLVRNCAPYSLGAEPMPEGADFPVWFLTEAESGYCTHYASTAVLMLRALGIPARLVTGYVVDTNDDPDVWEKVTTDSAHAWVECYFPYSGWYAFDATGSSASSETDETSVTDAQTTTTASESSTSAEQPTTTSGTASSHGASAAPQNSADTPSGSDAEKPELPDQYTSTGEKGSRLIGRMVKIILSILISAAALCAALVLVRWLINESRRKRFSEGTNNQRVLAMWNYILRLSTAAGKKMPPGIEEIMLRARFSQHMITDSELKRMTVYIGKLIESMEKQQNSVLRLVRKYILFYY